MSREVYVESRDPTPNGLLTVPCRRLKAFIQRAEARKNLNIDDSAKLAVYTGRLYLAQKETKYILQAAQLLPQYKFLLTGGKPDIVKYHRKYCMQRGIRNVVFTGYLSNYADIKNFQSAADVLISYYTKYDLNVNQCTPIKIAEYMCTRNPVVSTFHKAASDFVNPHNILLVEPDKPRALANGIRLLIEHKELASSFADKAFKTISENTIEKRAKLILNFVNGLTR